MRSIINNKRFLKSKQNSTENVTNQIQDYNQLQEKILQNTKNESYKILTPIFLTLTKFTSGIRLDKILSLLIPQYSRNCIKQWIKTGFVTVNNKFTYAHKLMLGNEFISIFPQLTQQEKSFYPEQINLDIIYEDNAILIINKQHGLVVHPAAGNWTSTLLNGLLYYCPKLKNISRAGIVHRLDKNTSGLLVIAKTLQAQVNLTHQLKTHSMKRHYLVLVWGKPNVSGVIEKAIARNPNHRIKMSVSNSTTAKFAITYYWRLTTGTLNNRVVSLIHCELKTGRTHQIRVHMDSIGYTVVGDILYGKKNLLPFFPRQALHAKRLCLTHPVTGEICEWESNLPKDFSNLLKYAAIDIQSIKLII